MIDNMEVVSDAIISYISEDEEEELVGRARGGGALRVDLPVKASRMLGYSPQMEVIKEEEVFTQDGGADDFGDESQAPVAVEELSLLAVALGSGLTGDENSKKFLHFLAV